MRPLKSFGHGWIRKNNETPQVGECIPVRLAETFIGETRDVGNGCPPPGVVVEVGYRTQAFVAMESAIEVKDFANVFAFEEFTDVISHRGIPEVLALVNLHVAHPFVPTH